MNGAPRIGLRRSAATLEFFEMTVYTIAQLKMTDRAAYDRYQARFLEVFRKFNGRLLAADEHPRLLEGTWPFDKLVMMSFPDEAAFLAFSNSPDYLEISRDRKAGAQATALLVKGFPPAG
jgi:uncharacterized protein (DUF1330 family)